VDLFFVISGFLITGILLRSRTEDGYFRNFYMRRVLRIWPLYFAFLLLMLVVLPAASPSAMAKSMQSARPVWAFPLFLQNLLVYGKIVGPLGITWSLAIEEQFYMAWPFFVWKLSRTALTRWNGFEEAMWRRRALQFGLPALAIAAICASYRPLLYSAVAIAMGAVVAYSLTLNAPSSK
jgi:peptidoglycan/LPS O-acetylase OafA/YrhL